jgi:hypothetical protein
MLNLTFRFDGAAALLARVLCFLCAVVGFHGTNVWSQFSDVTDTYGLYVESANGVVECGVSMHDFDRDGLVDLTYASNGMGVYTYRNTGEGFEQLYLFGAIEGLIAHPIWVDYDNDGDADFFATRGHDCPVLMRNDGDWVFTDVSDALQCSYGNPYSTCASWGDYNSDGWLDVYIANYYANSPGPTSWFYRNNGDGSFTEMASELQIDNGVMPAYQVMWIDYDLDLDQDLLISNDKGTGNRLYRNNGDGSFDDWSDESGFGVGLDAMSLSVSDFDHDADYDFYISNTEDGNYFMVNEQGLLTNQSQALQTEVNEFCWGTVFIDTEGKSWEDIYVVNTSTTGGNVLLKNQSGLQFVSNYDALGGEDSEFMYSVAKGDINGDGSNDIAVNAFTYNQSLLFESTLSPSTWIGVSLQGTVSNRDGIGAHVSCYISGVNLMRPKTCGENFMAQDSQYMLFGTNSNPVDSVVVLWPSGIRDVVYNPELNQVLHVVETVPANLVQKIDRILCSGDTLYLEPEGAAEVLWSNGLTDLILPVHVAGDYGASVTDGQGVQHEYLFHVEVAPEPGIELDIVQPACYGLSDGLIQWSAAEPVNVSVNGSSVDVVQLTELFSGVYYFTFEDGYGCVSNDSVVLTDPLPLMVESSVTPGCYGDSSHYVIASTQAQGNTFIIGLDDFQGYLPQGAYSYTVMDEMGCSFTSTLQVETMEPFDIQGYTDTICAGQSTGSVQLQFTGGIEPLSHVSDDLLLEALPPGEYQTQWMDAAGCIASGNIAILQFAPLEIEVEMNVGQIELDVEGGVPPYAIDWSNGDSGFILIGEPGEYTCVVSDAVGCTEQLVVELLVNMEELDRLEASPYPMPFGDVLNWSGAAPLAWSVFNAQGQLVADQTSLRWSRWDTRAWIPGVYLVDMIHTNGHCQRITLVKQ